MKTQVELSQAAVTSIRADVLAVPLFAEEVAGEPEGLLAALDQAVEGHLLRATRAERFTGKADTALSLATLGRLPAARLLLLGLGPRQGSAALAGAGFEALRMAAGRAGRAALQAGGGTLALALPAELAGEGVARAAVEGALLGAYRFDRYRSSARKNPPARLERVVVAGSGAATPAAAKSEVRLAAQVADAVAWARDRVNEAPLHCTPSQLARDAEALARGAGLRCEVLGPRELARLKMGLFLGVARGSAEEPRLVKLSWEPRRPGSKGAGRTVAGGRPRRPANGLAPLVLVGKAITFDSGRLSLKPTDSMVTMNGDMAGAAAVLAAMQVVAELAPPFPVHALVGACENMPGGRAYKPSDVLTACDGQTVEINNTDAEGRLVLGDLLAWARATLRPAGVVDLATLTGACVVALGHFTVGAFGPDGPVIDAVLAAARAAGEDTWRLPMVPDVRRSLESDVADMKNTGERWGGAISAAHFLHAFAGDLPWAHLDIAGPSHTSKERGYWAKGGTGVGVRTLVELVRAWRPKG